MNVIHYIGLDVHKKTISYRIKTADGRIVREGKLPALRSTLRSWAADLREPWCGAIEATLFSAWIYDTLKPYAQRLVMGHPAKMKAITAGKKKSDTIDARRTLTASQLSCCRLFLIASKAVLLTVSASQAVPHSAQQRSSPVSDHKSPWLLGAADHGLFRSAIASAGGLAGNRIHPGLRAGFAIGYLSWMSPGFCHQVPMRSAVTTYLSARCGRCSFAFCLSSISGVARIPDMDDPESFGYGHKHQHRQRPRSLLKTVYSVQAITPATYDPSWRPNAPAPPVTVVVSSSIFSIPNTLVPEATPRINQKAAAHGVCINMQLDFIMLTL